MNRILLLVLTGSVVFTSCEKKLSEYNPSGLTPDVTYANAKGFETLVNAAYTYTRFWYGKEEGYSVAEMGTDIWTNGTGDVFTQLSRYDNLQGSNTSALNLLWDNFYAAVFLCNTGLSKIADIPDYTPAQKTTREAELRFLRAFYYWHIVETWGGVHFTTEPAVGTEATANRTPVETFYKQIFADLDFAVKNLPPTLADYTKVAFTADYGRVTIPAVKAFLARLYLTRGMNDQALAMASDVIKNTNYTLVPKYADLWNMGNLKNKEVIWAIDYSTNLANNDLASSAYPSGHSRGSNNGHMLFLQVYDQVNTAILARDVPNGRPFNRYMPTKAFLDLFDETNDSRYQSSFQTVWYCNKEARTVGNTFTKDTTTSAFKKGDTVCYISKNTLSESEMNAKRYTTYDLSRVYKADGIPSQRKFYVSLKKFKDSTRTSSNEAQSARDVFVIRLAEMYLIAAEAELKRGNPDAAATYINSIRTRAANPGKEAAMKITGAQVTLDFILDERARELAGEQLRWFDLKRTNKLIDRIKSMNPDAAQYVQNFHYVRPIPQSQIDAVINKDEFKQNDLYQ